MSQTFEEHLQHLGEVFRRLEGRGLALNPEKCKLFRKELPFLGDVLTETGLKTDPEKTRAVLEGQVPKGVKELQTFLGMVGWYRKYIPEYAQVARPLFDLLKKLATWRWTEAQGKAFDALKTRLTEAPI